MAQQTAAKPDFHSAVIHEMRRRGWGFRTLARALAGDGATHEQVEIERRAVRRWLGQSKATPSKANRRRVAVALGLDEQLFDDDEEEDSLSAFLQRRAGQAAARATAAAMREWELRHQFGNQSRPPDLAVVAGAGSDHEGA